MAWNAILDIRHNCKECNRYRIFKPQDFSLKQQVLADLNRLKTFFEQKFLEVQQRPVDTTNSVIIVKKNSELCLTMIQECTQCDRQIDRVNKQIVFLK